jgi:hypothetical protein
VRQQPVGAGGASLHLKRRVPKEPYLRGAPSDHELSPRGVGFGGRPEVHGEGVARVAAPPRPAELLEGPRGPDVQLAVAALAELALALGEPDELLALTGFAELRLRGALRVLAGAALGTAALAAELPVGLAGRVAAERREGDEELERSLHAAKVARAPDERKRDSAAAGRYGRPVTTAATRERRRSTPWSADLFARYRAFSPYLEQAEALRELGTFPTPDQLTTWWGEPAGVRFVPQAPRRRGAGAAEYEALIAEGAIPTRAESWHDLMNALVWATFPRSKGSIHRSQRAEMERGRALGLLGRRTPRHDALAVVDEGGVIVVCDASLSEDALAEWAVGRGELGDTTPPEVVIFGHGVLESLAIDGPFPLVRAVVLRRSADPLDEHLASWIEGPSLTTPRDLLAVAPSRLRALTGIPAQPER